MKYNCFCCITCLLVVGLNLLNAQTGKLKGSVKDSSEKPVEMATVYLSETRQSCTTNSKGDFLLENIPAGNYKLVVALLGYSTKSVRVSIHENETSEIGIHLSQNNNQLSEVTVTGKVSVCGMGHLGEVQDGVIYSGKKNEVIALDSLDANTAQNNPRQVLGRIPGANFSETEGGGFPSNGFALRGLNPTQSVEMDTRQNGYNIAGDIYGYPESYYLPPLEAIQRIEVIRGASSLQYGPQFGGVINYIVKDAPASKPFEFTTEQTMGSYGLYNSFNGFAGTLNKWSYYTFVQYEGTDGWRPNSQVRQAIGFGKLEYKAGDKFKIGLEYSLLRNALHMPGGLDDAQFNLNADQSFRSRNWLTTPWNIIALNSEYKASDHLLFTFKSALNLSQRNIVWRNEDGGPQAPDTLNRTTGNYAPREVEHEGFKSSTSELRLLAGYSIGSREQNLAAGVRVFDGIMNREEGGPGSTGSDLDLNLYGGTYDKNLTFYTFNVAPFVENTFHVGKRLSITPGFRFEYIRSQAIGYVTADTGAVLNVNNSKSRYIPLAGIGLQFKTSETTNVYANISQAYRPIEYSFLYPLGLDVNAKIDPNLKDISGYNADFGWRGSIRNYLNFDVGGFYMVRNNDIAIETLKDSSTYETNVASAVYAGAETYVELNITRLFSNSSKTGSLSIFNSFAYDHASYVNGIYKGNQAEFAPTVIDRVGLTYAYRTFSTTFLFSSTAKSFSDANNTVFSETAETGIIPSYQVMDWSASLKIKNYKLKIGINNLGNTSYFTIRTNEYPGPGIIPSMGRSFYLGFGASF